MGVLTGDIGPGEPHGREQLVAGRPIEEKDEVEVGSAPLLELLHPDGRQGAVTALYALSPGVDVGFPPLGAVGPFEVVGEGYEEDVCCGVALLVDGREATDETVTGLSALAADLASDPATYSGVFGVRL